MRKIAIWMIALSLVLPSMNLKAEEVLVLTLESAITRAKTYSVELSQIRRQQELNGAKLTASTIEGSYKSYQKQYLENEYSDKEEGVQEKVIAYEMSKLFDEILLNEGKLKNLENSLKNDKLNLDNAQTKLKKGLISQTSFDKSLLTYETSKESIVQLKSTISTQYTSLCQKIGRSTTQFTLQKDPVIYKELEITGNLDGVLSSKAEQNLAVWKAVESAKINSEIDIAALEKAGSSYTTYLELQESTVKAQESSDSTKEQFENTLRSKYTELLQLQDKYKLQEKELQLLEKQIQAKAKQYELGRVAKIEYEKLKYSYEEAKISLLELVVKQEYIRQVIESPYLL